MGRRETGATRAEPVALSADGMPVALVEGMQVHWRHPSEIDDELRESAEARLEKLAEVCRSVRRPVVAIGGIAPQNASETLDAGASYIAVISALPLFIEAAAAQRASSKY